MATLKYYNGSAWTTVADGTAFKYYNGSNWVNPTKVQYYDGSNWQTVWNKSNAVTLVFQAVDSNSWRQGGWRGSNDLRIGSWDFGDHIGLASFVTGNNTNSATAADGTSVSADTLANHLAERTVINSCTLTLYRESGAGYNPIGATGNSENFYFGYYDGTIGSGDADDDINTTNMTTISASSLNALGWNYNESQTLTLNTTMAAELGTKELWMANRTSSFASSPGGGQDTTYSTFNGHSDSNKPTLTIELDYV
jgi:hypothetical protein